MMVVACMQECIFFQEILIFPNSLYWEKPLKWPKFSPKHPKVQIFPKNPYTLKTELKTPLFREYYWLLTTDYWLLLHPVTPDSVAWWVLTEPVPPSTCGDVRTGPAPSHSSPAQSPVWPGQTGPSSPPHHNTGGSLPVKLVIFTTEWEGGAGLWSGELCKV